MDSWITACAARPFMRSRFYPTRRAYHGIPRPDGPPHAHATGLDPDRILIVGTDAATGWGVRSHDLALPGQLARALRSETGRGVDVDLLADPRGVGIEALRPLVAGKDLHVYDAVVVVGGVLDAAYLLPEKQWTIHLRGVLGALRERTADGAPLVVLGIPPLSALPGYGVSPGGLVDSWTRRLNLAAQRLCDASPATFHVPAPATPGSDTGRFRSPEDYQRMALGPAQVLGPILDAAHVATSGRHASRDSAEQAHQRASAIAKLHLRESEADPLFDQIVSLARDVFGTEGAAFTLVDEERRWAKASIGLVATDIPLAESFCATTVLDTHPLVVEDSRTDPRSPENTPFRFYAGHPVEAPDGTRIGALCVFDSKPHSVHELDLVFLRDLALALQEHLARGASGAGV